MADVSSRTVIPRGAHERVLMRNVSIDDPIMAHTDGSMTIVLQRVKSLYSGVCQKKMLILDVLGIINLQPAEIEYGANIGAGQTLVQFKALVISYVPGDVVAGFVVVKKDTNMLQARLVINGETRMFVSIPANDLTESIAIGQKIIVKFTRLDYMYGLRTINGTAEIYAPVRKSRVYQCGGEYQYTTEAEQLLERLAELQAELAAVPNWERYRDVLYPWDTKQHNSIPKGATEMNLSELAAADGVLPQFIARDSRVLTTPKTAIVYAFPPGAAFPGDYVLVQGVSMETVIIDLIRSEIDAIILLLDAAAAYDGGEFGKHANLWKVMRTAIARTG